MIQEKLKELRGNLTQEEFAKKLSVSKSLYQKLERGERGLSKRTLKKLKSLFPALDVNIFFE